MSFLFTPDEIFGKLQHKTLNEFYDGIVGTKKQVPEKVAPPTIAVSGLIMGFKSVPIQFNGMINRFVNFQANVQGMSMGPRRGARGGSLGNDRIYFN